MKLSCAAPLWLALSLASLVQGAELRVGIIGTDTSHATDFTELLNNRTNRQYIPGARVVAAFKGGSPDIPSSWSRVEGYAAQLQKKHDVKIVGSIEELCQQVDAVLLESVDGRPHLEQARVVFQARKPVFIDKPIAGSLRDAIEIRRLALQFKVPCFSASSYRFYESMRELMKTDVGTVRSAISYGPADKEPHHPDFYWYGVHATEALYTALGQGCERVVRVASGDTDVAVGTWSGGRTGTLMGLRTGATPHRVILFGTKSVTEQKGSGDYAPLIREIVRFLQTGVAPVSLDETVEMFAFMEAADESKRRGGSPVDIQELLKQNGWVRDTPVP
jgi:Oxidoreductase family, NAD-binding Rossmann fold